MNEKVATQRTVYFFYLRIFSYKRGLRKYFCQSVLLYPGPPFYRRRRTPHSVFSLPSLQNIYCYFRYVIVLYCLKNFRRSFFFFHSRRAPKGIKNIIVIVISESFLKIAPPVCPRVATDAGWQSNRNPKNPHDLSIYTWTQIGMQREVNEMDHNNK